MNPPKSSYRGGSGEPLVLLHGFTDTWTTWLQMLPELEKHHDVLALTLPGHFGARPWEIPQPFSLSHVVDAIEAEMDAAGIEKAHIAGNSLGGWLALELAVRGRALSVVALCPGGGWIRGGRDERRILRYFKRNRMLAPRAAKHAEWLARHPRLRRISLREIVSYPEKVTPERYVEALYSSAGCDIAHAAIQLARQEGFSDLGPIDCPVRIAWGGNDRLIRWPNCFIRFRRLVPHAEFVELPGLGHVPMWDDPEATNRAILEVTRAKTPLTKKTAEPEPSGFR